MMLPETTSSLVLLLTLLLLNLTVRVVSADNYTRYDFPADFVFGSGTSAYQWEGAASEDGRTPSIWDTFAHAGHVHGDNGDVACSGYYKYKEDVQLMVETGLDAYRFSISWSRLIPNGRGPVNPKGLEFYNNLINELISNGIQPHVTLHNFDLPQALEDEYGGWISRDIIRDFTAYAEGLSPPARCSPPFGLYNCTRGNSPYEPYIAAHHILLAHSSIARLYRRKYKDKQHGYIGVSLYTFALTPYTNSEKDIMAIQRVTDFYFGWFMEPFLYGDYPVSMKKLAGSKIPSFTDRESKQVKGSCDFIGIIHYAILNVTDNSESWKRQVRDINADMGALTVFGQALLSEEEYPVSPWSLQQVLDIFKLRYGNPPVYVYENGQRTASNSTLKDVSRVEYLRGYIGGMLDSLRNGSNIRGYFEWSFLDLFELLDGYKSSFGLYYVDRNDPELRRYPKLSAYWYSNFLRGRSTSTIEEGSISSS
ncbi:hypothetical protein L6164_034689 [Bauhinia variegata]|uniref:Uncharacterized protein n=1 Tax=Bauhinia variegata TaxID=167791 RepID=A0ACB9KVJ2_BAUVA|nr:hypothetical protein L6164_034689 [Bauhinia variegata]